jgi:hypothetical protein
VPAGACERNVLQLLPLARVAQEQTAPTHVAATDEGRRKVKAIAEYLKEGVDVLPRGDAPEQDDIVRVTHELYEALRIPDEGLPIPRVEGADVDTREGAKRSQRDRLVGRQQSAVRCDHQHPRGIGGRVREGSRVSDLPSKVETAQEGEYLAERRTSGSAKTQREWKARALVEDEPGALAARAGRGKQKDPSPHGTSDRYGYAAVV